MDASQYNGQFIRASEPAQHVLLLEMNRGPVNAFHDPFWMELRAIVDRVSYDPMVRVIVLSSALDKFFTAGLDIKAASIANKGQVVDVARKALQMQHHIIDFQDAISSLERARQPVIAAMYGQSLGLAVDIASACDIRLAATDVVLGIMEVKVGLAADIGTLQRLPKVVGNGSKARELALTGRKFGAAEAKEIGFISEAIPGSRQEVIGAAVKLAAEIAANSPIAVVGTKHIMNYSRDHSVAEGLAYQAAVNMSLLQSEDTVASIKAVRTKTQAVFAPISDPKAKL